MSVNKRNSEVGTETKDNFKVQISHVSDSSTELHEDNVYLALVVCAVCLLRYQNVSLLHVDQSPTKTNKMSQ